MIAEYYPNLRHMAGIVAIADTGSMSEAAVQLNLSQPALAQGLAKVERQMKGALFRRDARGMRLSEAGEMFVARLRRGFDILRQASPVTKRSNLHQLVTMNQMLSLIAAVDHGGFRPAAARLGRAPSSLSRACRDLADQAGTPLFEVGPIGFRPTRQAEELARVFRLTLNEIHQAAADVRGLQGDYAGRLAIGCLPLAQAVILPETLNRFAPEFPGISPQVVGGRYADLVQGLLNGDLDVLVGALRREAVPGALTCGLTHVPLFSDGLVVAARAGHPLAGKAAILLEDLKQFPWVVPGVGAPARGCYDQLFATGSAAPASVPKPVETEVYGVVGGLLRSSDRLAILARSQFPRDNGLKQLDFELPDSQREIGLTYIEGWLPSVPQARFLSLLGDVFSETTQF
ncbi:LysR family transcriptional regulator [Pseudooceanicola spongiae]|uniref:LysR family transcriptional regulator n=1 Tax=Pseudooceanicola spongiae TaxID=2613965 RepID=A0A7L9WJB4_9RHOB|nr:LysR family transcriptional regulator [Pseudooceanicola spongiae]QOL79436.1 LysR family transcriptional regulator [Pseudooceanicola spongiae]